MKERKHNYLIGYVGEGQVAYGKEILLTSLNAEKKHWVELMTPLQAKRALKKLSSHAPSAIYKLVKVNNG